MLAALEISHEMGLVHRDIKPGNVMMTKRGVVKVMDFGIARAMQSGVTSMTQTGMVVGTPQYLSPEQALGRGVDARSDLYSVGIMLFQLLTGRLPFDADSPLAIAYAHVQEEPVAPSSINRVAAAGGGRAGRPRAEEEPERALPDRRRRCATSACGSRRRVQAAAPMHRAGRRRRRAARASAPRSSRRSTRATPAPHGQRPDAVPAGPAAEPVRHAGSAGRSGVRLPAAAAATRRPPRRRTRRSRRAPTPPPYNLTPQQSGAGPGRAAGGTSR